MNARAVAAWSGGALVVVLLTMNPVYRALVLVCALAFLATESRREVSLKPLLRMMVLAVPLSVVLSTLFDHQGSHALAHLPAALTGIGGAITLEAAAFGFTAGLGIAAAVAAAAPLVSVLYAHQIIDALPSPLLRTGAVLGAALNMAPGIARSYRDVSEAQRLRAPQRRGLRAASQVLVPVTLTAMENSIQLAEAMEARAFGAGPRTQLRTAGWRPREVVVAVAALAAAAAFVAARALGVVIDWYPLPALSAPPVSPLLVLGCALLALPALRWRTQS